MQDTYVLQRCSDIQLAWLIMRELYRMYDHGGHSGRSIRSMVLEAGMSVCFRSWEDPDIPSHVSRDALAREVARRGADAIQLGLFDQLTCLTTEDYLRCVVTAVHSLHNTLIEPSVTEALCIDLLARLLHTERMHISSYEAQVLIREGRNRAYRAPALE